MVLPAFDNTRCRAYIYPMLLTPSDLSGYYATCFRGLEAGLADELKALGCAEVVIDRESVFFKTTLKNAWLCNYVSRLANKIVLVLGTRQLRGIEDLYKQSAAIAWEDLFGKDRTFKVETSSIFSRTEDSRICNLKIKDAVADRFSRLFGRRPDVNKEDADVYIDCRIFKNESMLGLNLSGERLFRRGYREETNAAPVKETLAAGIVGFALEGKTGLKRVIDPMAGSGTLVIEAAMAVLGIPAAKFRWGFSFQHLRSYDSGMFEALKKDADAGRRAVPSVEFVCCDHSEPFLADARTNIANAKLTASVKVVRQDFFDPKVDMTDSLIIFNPPYGERMKGAVNLAGFYKRIGDTLKKHCKGSTAWIFTEHGPNTKAIGLRSSRSIPLFNGKIECRLLEFRMY